MPNVVRALLGAAVMLLVAWAGRAGWIDEDLSRGMLIVMPALAVLTMRRGCRQTRAVQP